MLAWGKFSLRKLSPTNHWKVAARPVGWCGLKDGADSRPRLPRWWGRSRIRACPVRRRWRRQRREQVRDKRGKSSGSPAPSTPASQLFRLLPFDLSSLTSLHAFGPKRSVKQPAAFLRDFVPAGPWRAHWTCGGWNTRLAGFRQEQALRPVTFPAADPSWHFLALGFGARAGNAPYRGTNQAVWQNHGRQNHGRGWNRNG